MQTRRKHAMNRLFLLLALFAVPLLAVACGSDSDGGSDGGDNH